MPWTQRPKDMQGRQCTSWSFRREQQCMLAAMVLSTVLGSRASPTVAGPPPEPRAKMELERQCVQQVAAAVTALAHRPANDWWEALGTLPTGHNSTRIPVRGSNTIYEVFGSISACRPSVHIPCAEDATLPAPPKQRVLIAGNLKDNAALMPHFIQQILLFIASMPQGSAFVSIYESDSRDLTGVYLEVLGNFLDRMEVRHRISTGGVKRKPKEDRIAFLARIRNLAAAPLQQGPDGSKPEWPADRLLFINDVYFCAKDIWRLLQHSSTDVACGMDFYKNDPAPVVFYDIWVMRDAEGQRLKEVPPYVHHPYSKERLIEGLPIPVTCCWNGMVNLNAEPFMKGLQFRAPREGECSEAEQNMMCTDLYHEGYQNFIVDPGVRVAYQPHIAQALYSPHVPLKLTSFGDILKAPAIEPDFIPKKFVRECCAKDMDSDAVHFSNCTREAPYGQTFYRSAPATT